MTIYTVENFHNSTNSADYVSLGYKTSGNFTSNSFLGKNCFSPTSGTVSRLFSSTQSTVYFGCRIYVAPAGSTPGAVYLIGGPTNTISSPQLTLTFELDGSIVFSSSGPTNTANAAFQIGVPFYFEIGSTCSPSNGTAVIMINGEVVMDLTNVDTDAASQGHFQGFGLSSGDQLSATDFYYCDNTGSAPFNTFLGPIDVQTILCDANSNAQFKAIGSPTNWQAISTIDPNPNIVYNTSNVVSQVDLFTTANVTAPNINETLVVISRTMADGVAGHSLQQVVISGSVIDRGPTDVLSSTFTYYDAFFLTNPGTGSTWTLSEVNSIETGYQLIT